MPRLPEWLAAGLDDPCPCPAMTFLGPLSLCAAGRFWQVGSAMAKPWPWGHGQQTGKRRLSLSTSPRSRRDSGSPAPSLHPSTPGSSQGRAPSALLWLRPLKNPGGVRWKC